MERALRGAHTVVVAGLARTGVATSATPARSFPPGGAGTLNPAEIASGATRGGAKGRSVTGKVLSGQKALSSAVPAVALPVVLPLAVLMLVALTLFLRVVLGTVMRWTVVSRGWWHRNARTDDEEAVVGRVPVRGEVAAGGRGCVEIVVVPAIEGCRVEARVRAVHLDRGSAG